MLTVEDFFNKWKNKKKIKKMVSDIKQVYKVQACRLHISLGKLFPVTAA